MGAYAYGRPHVGFQALISNVLLREQGALGYTTELLSGDFNAPFGRSSHHQIWSEAMVATPLLRGLLGIQAVDGGQVLYFFPQLPANWDRVAVRNVRAGQSQYDLTLERTDRRLVINVTRREQKGAGGGKRLRQLVVAPAFPRDTRFRKVTVNGRNT